MVGLGFAVKVAIVFTLGVFPVIINTWQGVKNVPRTLVKVGIAFVCTRRMIMREIVVLGRLPYIMTGLRLCVGRCIIGMGLIGRVLHLDQRPRRRHPAGRRSSTRRSSSCR